MELSGPPQTLQYEAEAEAAAGADADAGAGDGCVVLIFGIVQGTQTGWVRGKKGKRYNRK